MMNIFLLLWFIPENVLSTNYPLARLRERVRERVLMKVYLSFPLPQPLSHKWARGAIFEGR